MKFFSIAFLILVSNLHAALFTNKFIQFELPTNWECKLEGAEWVCQSKDKKQSKDAIIVLAAKLKGPKDSLDQYKSYLNKPKFFKSVQGKSVKSEPKYSRVITLNDQSWVDSLHLESEIPGFFTRYLGTIKHDIAVVITYSVNKKKHALFQKEFEALVQSLRVFRNPGQLNVKSKTSNAFSAANIPTNMGQTTVFAPINEDTPRKKKKDDTTLYIIIGAIVIGFILMKMRNKKS